MVKLLYRKPLLLAVIIRPVLKVEFWLRGCVIRHKLFSTAPPLLHYAANVALEGMNALLYTIFVIPDGLLEILTFLGKSYVKHFFNYLR